MKSRSDSQLNLPPTHLQNLSGEPESRKKVAACAEAAAIFSEAIAAAGFSQKEIALHLEVSESLVSRWCSPNYSEAPTVTQLFQLPPRFHLQWHRAMNRHFGFGRAALARLLEAVGDVALAVD